jgi:hypothetical protein
MCDENNGLYFGWLDLLAPWLQVLLITLKYSAIADLHNFQFTVAHALGVSISWQRISTQKLALQITMKTSCYFVFSHSGTAEQKFFCTHSSSLRLTRNCPWTNSVTPSVSQSQSHIPTDGQSVYLSWCRAPAGAHDQMFLLVWELPVLSMWGQINTNYWSDSVDPHPTSELQPTAVEDLKWSSESLQRGCSWSVSVLRWKGGGCTYSVGSVGKS